MSISEYDVELRSKPAPTVGAGYIWITEARLAEGEDGRSKFTSYFVGKEPTLGNIAYVIQQKIEYLRGVDPSMCRLLDRMLQAMELEPFSYSNATHHKSYTYRFANVKILSIEVTRKHATYLN